MKTTRTRASVASVVVVCLLVCGVAEAAVVAGLTEGAWSAYALASKAVDVFQVARVGSGATLAQVFGQAWVAGLAKVPWQPVDAFFHSTPAGIVSGTAERSYLFGTAYAGATASTATGYAFGANSTGLAFAAAAAGSNGKWHWDTSGGRVLLAVLVTELALDPRPIPDPGNVLDLGSGLTGEGVPAASYMEFDIMQPGTSDWTAVREISVSMVWDDEAEDYGLLVDDSMDELTAGHFSKSVVAGQTSFTLASPVELTTEVWATDDLTESGNPWQDGDEFGAQVWSEGAAQSVPEPATLSLLALGALAVLRRRKK